MQFDLTAGAKEASRAGARDRRGFDQGTRGRNRPKRSLPLGQRPELTSAGLMGYTIPKAYGGAGGSFLDASLIVEEMARVCGVTGRIAVEANMGAISAVMRYGSEKQKRLAAELVSSGDKPAICITEPDAGSAATEMTTRADKRGRVCAQRHEALDHRRRRLAAALIFARVFDERGDGGGYRRLHHRARPGRAG